MSRLLIVDGCNLLFQMFFGMPARIVNSEGKAIQGTLGFVGSLLKIIRMVEPTHIAVIFDGQHENVRTAIDPDYKANRPDLTEAPDKENPFSQLADVYSALDYLGIKHTETSNCEADDVIAGYALTLGSEADIIISSFDSDFFQLITDKVRVLRYRGEKTTLCDTAYIREKLDIEPDRYADHKSLTGDSADNIKGVPGVGKKTAAALINEFGGLENIIANAAQIKKPSVRRAVIDNVGRLRKNYSLIKLDNTAKLPFELHELEYRHSGVTTTDVLKDIGLK